MATINPNPFAHFADFIELEKEKYVGRDLAGTKLHYIPYGVLSAYWTDGRINSVLKAAMQAADGRSLHLVEPQQIHDSLLRTFSTLVYAGASAVLTLHRQFISYLIDDEKLPLAGLPSEWSKGPVHRDLYELVQKHQWMFFPLHFSAARLRDRELPKDMILPLTDGEELARGDVACVRMIDVHNSYSELGPKDANGQSGQRTFVLKTYQGLENEPQYERELGAMTRMKTAPSPNIIELYASFKCRQLGSYNILMEYADGGNLEDFFKNTRRPSNSKEVALFWRSLLKIFHGVDRIHLVMRLDGGHQETFSGIHQDLKPANILLMKGPSGSPFDFIPKIADFGLFDNVRQAPSSSDSLGKDYHGNPRFSAPECAPLQASKRQRGIVNLITTASDMFSIGAVLSHTAAWVVGGLEAQEAYRVERRKFHKETGKRLGTAYEDSFHNGLKISTAIAKDHARFSQGCVEGDTITPFVLRVCKEDLLLVDPKDRKPARTVMEMAERHFETIVGPIIRAQSPSIASQATTQTPMSSRSATMDSQGNLVRNVGSRRAKPPVLVPNGRSSTNGSTLVAKPRNSAAAAHSRGFWSAHIFNRIIQKATQAFYNSTTESRAVDASPLASPLYYQIDVHRVNDHRTAIREGHVLDPETQNLFKCLEQNLGGRDQFFFIVDSESMKQHLDIIEKVFRALACIAKRLDPNKVELAFASNPNKIHRARKTSKLLDIVTKHSYTWHSGFIERSMDTLVDNIMKRLPIKVWGYNINPNARKEVSVYIFTDGHWGTQEDCLVERPVGRLIDEILKQRLGKGQVSLHFVRFGNSDLGKRQLDKIDKFGKTKNGMDIVDVKSIANPVIHIVIGPLDPTIDAIGEETNGVEA